MFSCSFVEDTVGLEPAAPTWSTQIWTCKRTGVRGSWRAPPFYLTGGRWALLNQKWKKTQRFSSAGRTVRTGGTLFIPGSVASWEMCCFFCSSMYCKGFLWDWLAASRWSYRVRASATRTKPSSALSSGHLASSFSGHHWWMLCTSAGLEDGKENVCALHVDFICADWFWCHASFSLRPAESHGWCPHSTCWASSCCTSPCRLTRCCRVKTDRRLSRSPQCSLCSPSWQPHR